ncbi:MAG TPA: HAMP domain-containing sensor histidine kinase, partial [Phycisphaerales bacterium]|nr:HAMP domain-containing sensor histidine kinase [Phycisphaerales bacterium]
MSEQTTTDWKREAAIWRARAEHLQAAVDRLRSLAVAGESVGFLAHELNNLYTPVVGYCHAAQAPGADEIVRTKAIAKSLAAAERVGELTSLVLRLAGTASEGAELGGAADLHECVSGGLAVLGAEQWTREGIEVSLDVPRGTCVGASMGLVQQVVMNLVLNGRRAMNGRRGRVEVSAREVEGGVRMEVRDGGVGMDAAVMGRVLGITQGDDAAWINHPAGSTGHGGSRGAAGEIGVAAPVGDRYEVDVQELARSGSINGQARWGVRMKRAAGERSAREKGVREPASTINQSGAAAGQQRAGEKKIARLRAAKIDASASPIRVWDAQEVAAELRALREGCGGDLAPQSSGQRVEGQEQVGGAER